MDGSTLNIHDEDTRAMASRPREVGKPSLRILYHGDLERVGEFTSSDLFEGGKWVGLGRTSPDFHALDRSTGPIADPYISRAQAALRWDDRAGCFEVKPASGARLKLSSVTLHRGSADLPEFQEVSRRSFLPPGTLLAIGDRVLLALLCDPSHGAEEDRMGMIGESAQMWELRKAIEDTARFARPALVLGETGAGKELVSRALHTSGDRSRGPFLAANCAALPEHLVESILFGHKKGAFTGASKDSPGLFLDADGGTLFLDEVGELPMVLQAKLLRALQEGVVMPVGGRKEVKVDVRVVAATNRAPAEEMQSGKLRSDLYYRLSAHVLKVPSLRERYVDVPLLFVHLLKQHLQDFAPLAWMFSSSMGSRLPVPMDFFLKLMKYPWPGNVRELQNVATQSAQLNLNPGSFAAPSLEESAMVPAPRLDEPVSDFQEDRGLESEPQVLDLDNPLLLKAAQEQRLKRKTLARLLRLGEPVDLGELRGEELEDCLAANLFLLMEEEGFNQTRVARELEVARGTLISLMKRFGLPRAQDLSLEQIREARDAAHGNLTTMSRALRVSPASLKGRLTHEGLEGWLQG